MGVNPTVVRSSRSEISETAEPGTGFLSSETLRMGFASNLEDSVELSQVPKSVFPLNI